MRKSLVCALLGACAVSASAFAADSDLYDLGDLLVTRHWDLNGNMTMGGPEAVTAGSIYSNVTTAQLAGQPASIQVVRHLVTNTEPAPSTNGTITNMIMDDITPAGGAGLPIRQLTFSVANLTGTTVGVRPRIRFWNADGASGGPGTYYAPGGAAVGFSFAPLAIQPGVTLLTGTIATSPTVLFPAPAGRFWAGLTFDNANMPGVDIGSTGEGPFIADGTQMGFFGSALFNPVDLGSSNPNEIFTTSGAGSFFGTANPAGSIGGVTSPLAANLGWEFVVLPEPGAISLVAAGMIGLIRRRK